MTTHERHRAASYTSEKNRPKAISASERQRLERFLTTLERGQRRKKFFAVRLPATGAKHYVVFTEKFVDVCTIFVWEKSRTQLSMVLGAPAADGVELVKPRAITDLEWDQLAREPYFRDTFYDVRCKHGRELAETMLGAHFDGGPQVGDVFLITRELDTEVDLFVRPRGAPLRHVMSAEYVSEA